MDLQRVRGKAAGRGLSARIVPALGWNPLTRLYDPLMRMTMPEERFRNRLLERSGLGASRRVLDLGCGTGALALLAARRFPAARWTGIDADRRILEIAARKAAGAALALVEARAGGLPFSDGAFDRVVSSLVLHHLTQEEKRRALTEAFRVTAPGGELHIADWGPPRGRYARAAFALARFLDGRETTADNAAGRLPAMIEEAGFRLFGVAERIPTVFGTLELLSGRKPPSERR